jgi:hypothetical protein
VIAIKHGKRPTAEQRKLMKKWKLNPEDWLITKNTPTEMHLVNRWSDKTTRIIPKEIKEKY